MNSRVVVAAYAECAGSEPAAVFEFSLCTISRYDVKQGLVFSLGWNDNHIVEVLCTSADKRDTTYVNLLDEIDLVIVDLYPLATVCSKG